MLAPLLVSVGLWIIGRVGTHQNKSIILASSQISTQGICVCVCFVIFSMLMLQPFPFLSAPPLSRLGFLQVHVLLGDRRTWDELTPDSSNQSRIALLTLSFPLSPCYDSYQRNSQFNPVLPASTKFHTVRIGTSSCTCGSRPSAYLYMLGILHVLA